MSSSRKVRCRLSVVSDLPDGLGYIPFSPVIDFAELIRRAGAPGRFDPNSVEVVDLADGSAVEFARTGDFAHGDEGRIEWVIRDPSHREYEIRFRTAEHRPFSQPKEAGG